MAGAETLFNLFLRAREKYSEGCNNFEEHFSWLEEVVATARQTFATLEPALLPKTPRTKKKYQKRPLQPCIAEEAESPPTKRTSTCSKDSNQDAHDPVEVLPRRGRAASRIAQEKMKRDLQNDGNRKLRRPSTPEVVATTSRKIRGSQRAVHCRDSPEGDHSLKQVGGRKVPSGSEEIDGKTLIVKLQAEQVLDPKAAINHVSSHDTPKKKSDSITRLSVRLSGERWPCVDTSQITDGSQNITQVMVSNLQQENGVDHAHVLVDDCTYSALRLDDSEDDESEEKEMNVQISKAETEIGKERELSLHDNSPQTLNEKPLISDKEDTCFGEGVEVLPKPLENLPKPIPRGRTTRTKQRELLLSSEDDKCAHDAVVGAFDSPYPVPTPRVTRIKQKKEIHTEIVKNELSGTHVLPPSENSNSRVTRTKTRAIKQDSSSKKEESDSHFFMEEGADNYNQADSLFSDELPKPHSTRTKKKTVEVESDTENSVTRTANEEITNTESQNPRITRTKKREAEEQTLEQPARSTRTKRKKVEEVSEKDSVDQENMSLHITSTESEYEKERKSLKDEINSTYVKPNSSTTSKNMEKHDCFPESVSYEEPPVKPKHLSASCTSVRSAQNAEDVVVGRITRSKVRQLPPVKVTPKKVSPSTHITKNVMSPKTPVRSCFKRVCCTPKSDSETPKASAMHQKGTFRRSPMKHSPRPFSSSGPGHTVCSAVTAHQNHIREAFNEVEELTSEDCEVPHSPAQVSQHSLRKALKTQDSNGMQMNNLSKTVSPVFPSEKVIRLKVNHISSSGSTTPKTYSRIQPTYSSSSEYSKTQKKIGTPNEVKRGGNIISGIASFIKVQPAKMSREDIVEKRLAELQRKKERVEESMKKKEELLKLKAEERKRYNEERIRRVQEAREERERKAIEAKEQQEKDRKQREERKREEQQRRKQLLAKKRAEEEAKVRKIREQQEEERKRREEEIRKLMEEEKRAEEAKRLEEEKLAHMAEQCRLQEEEKKRRVAEVERITREKMELERLKLREAERIAEGKQVKIICSSVKKVALNDTYTASDNKENSDHNSTFTKTCSNQSNSSGKEPPNKNEMTPDCKKTKKEDAINNYNIADMGSDDSTDDERAPKKKVPAWASASQLRVALINQEYYPPAVEKIFPPDNLLIMPDLSKMFPIQRRRFHKRTSSATWNTPPAKSFESN